MSRSSTPRWTRPEPPDAVEAQLQGAIVRRVGRSGKYLVWELSDERYLLVHLRMTGALLFDPDAEPIHTRVRFELDAAATGSIYVDPRRFGTGHLLHGAAQRDAYLAARLGVEPFTPEFTAAHLRELARGPQRADQVVRARPAADRRRREHLRRRGAVPGPDPSAARRRASSRRPSGARWRARSRRRWPPGSRPRARRSTTSATSTARADRSRIGSSCTAARASRARGAARRSARSSSAAAAPTCASTVSPSRRAAPRRGGRAAACDDRSARPRARLAQAAGAVGGQQLVKAAERLALDHDLRERDHPGPLLELRATVRVPCQIDLFIGDTATFEQRLGADAPRAVDRSCKR